MAQIPQPSRSKAPELLNDILKQLIVLSVGSIGFLFTIRSTGHVHLGATLPYNSSLGGFLASIVMALLGQMAMVFEAFRKPAHYSRSLRRLLWLRRARFLRNPKYWFYAAWVGFSIGIASFMFVAFGP